MKRSGFTFALNRFLDVPVSDADEARRRKLLNIILAGIAFLSVVMVLIVFFLNITGQSTMAKQDSQLAYVSGFALIFGTLIFYSVNRNLKIPGWVASGSFLVFLLVILGLTDSPQELADGRSLFVFAIPIIMSSMLLRPSLSFLFSLLVSLEIIVLARIGSVDPNAFAMATFILLALVSWLSARGLEQALKELRVINTELDHRVEERTRELSAALTRELAEAGKNQAILEGIADGVIVFDTQDKSIVVNPALSRLLNISPTQLLNRQIDEILKSGNIAAPDRDAIVKMFSEPYKDNPSIRFRWGERTLLVNAAPVNIGLGEEIGMVAVFRDFTREAEVEQMKNTFVAMVSHELRTPLNAILGYAEMMREAVYGVLNVRQAGIMERIESSSKRLLGMVSDLLDQAQLEAGRMRILESEFKTSDLIDAVHAMLDKEFEDKGLALKVELDPRMPATLRGDSHRLQQILLNLTGNAVKFAEKGEVNARIFRADPDFWGMEVSDTGPGIPPEAQQYIFESFRQADNVTTRKHGGIGLGLAIVRSLVQVLGGKIALKSKVGEGTTFTVILPFAHAKEEK